MKEECEVDARKKFELGAVPSQLAGLWLSKYGYTTKNDMNLDGDMALRVTIDYGGAEE
jgi:hypothetical protein